jgi:hypothetical protein
MSKKAVPESLWNRDHPFSTRYVVNFNGPWHNAHSAWSIHRANGHWTGKAAAKLLDCSHSGLDGFNCRWILKFLTRWMLFLNGVSQDTLVTCMMIWIQGRKEPCVWGSSLFPPHSLSKCLSIRGDQLWPLGLGNLREGYNQSVKWKSKPANLNST